MTTRELMTIAAALALGWPAALLSAQPHELKTRDATLTLDQEKDLLVIESNDRIRRISSRLSDWWNLTLRNTQTKQTRPAVRARAVAVQASSDALRVTCREFAVGREVLPVVAELRITVEEDVFKFSGSVTAPAGTWRFEDVRWAVGTEIAFRGPEPAVYWPHDLGLRFDTPREFGSRIFDYPSPRGAMAWFALQAGSSGVYVGVHDPERGAKTFELKYEDGARAFRLGLAAPVHDTKYTMPLLVVRLYQGTWHEGAKTYRAWFDRHFRRALAPEWLRRNDGFILAVFKQQNGDLMWKYRDLDTLCDIGERLNFRLLGVWGWGVGGHDRAYPNYMPDNLMGGRLELQQAIERAHQRGFKVIVYSNGTLIDTATDYYLYNGLDTMLTEANGRPVVDFYVKHNNATPVLFARACPGSKVWRDTILSTALAAQDLGVDAFYIDQVGVRGPDLCHSARHDHQRPQESHTTWRVAMMKEIRNRLRQTAPEFPVMTEGSTDTLLEDADCFHSIWGRGPASPGARAGSRTRHQFPELYRYTFPETVIIYLNSQPVLPRWDANYSVVYGLRHEIMSRYPADVEFLKTGKAPTARDYANVNVPPSVDLINEVPSEEAFRYIRELTQWQGAHADLLRLGNFIDEDGIVVTGKDILAKGFAAGTSIGVVVWNMHLQETREFTVSVPGYRLLHASAPGSGAVEAGTPLAANALRLLTFAREGARPTAPR